MLPWIEIWVLKNDWTLKGTIMAKNTRNHLQSNRFSSLILHLVLTASGFCSPPDILTWRGDRWKIPQFSIGLIHGGFSSQPC